MADIKWGEPVAGWRLSASLDKPVFEPGERILLTVVFENASGTEQEYGAQSRDHDYVLDCATDYGQSVPLTRFGQRMAENRGHGRYITNALQPNEHLINEIVVTRHLDLTLPGKYTLSVSREIYPHEGRGQPPVKSKACEFEIIE